MVMKKHYLEQYEEARGPLTNINPSEGSVQIADLDLQIEPSLVLNSNLNELIGENIGIIRLPVNDTEDCIFTRILEGSQ